MVQVKVELDKRLEAKEQEQAMGLFKNMEAEWARFAIKEIEYEYLQQHGHGVGGKVSV